MFRQRLRSFHNVLVIPGQPQQADCVPRHSRTFQKPVAEHDVAVPDLLLKMKIPVTSRQYTGELKVVRRRQHDGRSLRELGQDLRGGGDALDRVGASQDLVHDTEHRDA